MLWCWLHTCTWSVCKRKPLRNDKEGKRKKNNSTFFCGPKLESNFFLCVSFPDFTGLCQCSNRECWTSEDGPANRCRTVPYPFPHVFRQDRIRCPTLHQGLLHSPLFCTLHHDPRNQWRVGKYEKFYSYHMSGWAIVDIGNLRTRIIPERRSDIFPRVDNMRCPYVLYVIFIVLCQTCLNSKNNEKINKRAKSVPFCSLVSFIFNIVSRLFSAPIIPSTKRKASFFPFFQNYPYQ